MRIVGLDEARRSASMLRNAESNTLPEALARVQHAKEQLVAIRQRQAASNASIEEFSAQHTRISGEFMLNGMGEQIVTLDFGGTLFTEKPLASFGGEVRNWNPDLEYTIIGKGEFPTVSCVIVGWSTVHKPPERLLYSGCRMAVVVTGWHTQKMFIHWHIEGVALQGPASYDPIPLVE